MYSLWMPEEGAEFSRNGVWRSCELLDWLLRTNFRPLEEQLVLFAFVFVVLVLGFETGLLCVVLTLLELTL